MYPATEKYHFTKEQILNEEDEIRAAMKDISLFSVLYDRYYVRLFQFVFYRVDTEDEAADVTSQVFLKAMLNLKKYQFRGLPFASWLYRIASNEISDAFRSDQVNRVFHATTEYLGQIAADMHEDPNEEKILALKTAMSTLKMDEMELIELRYFEERPLSEITQITGLTLNNAKVKLHRIIQKLTEKTKKLRS